MQPNDIYFKNPKVLINISNKSPYVHKFSGENLSGNVIKVTKVTKGCSCISTSVPSEIQPKSKFTVEMTVDKTGQTGLYSTMVQLEFDNTQTIKLVLSGKLLENENA